MYHTIPGFEEMTAQQIFDMSASHLLKQNAKSVEYPGEGGACLYRRGKLMCAAGVFLTDEGARIADTMEGEEGTAWDEVVGQGIAPAHHQSLITRLQSIHDFYDPPAWPAMLKSAATDFNLNDDVVTKRINE